MVMGKEDVYFFWLVQISANRGGKGWEEIWSEEK